MINVKLSSLGLTKADATFLIKVGYIESGGEDHFIIPLTIADRMPRAPPGIVLSDDELSHRSYAFMTATSF